MQELELLYVLQQIDSKIRETEKNRERFPEEIQRIEEHIERASEELKTLEDEIEERKKRRRALEQELTRKEDEVTKTKRRYPELKTNKEYEAYLKELDKAKLEMSRMEDEILLIMEEVDRLDKVHGEGRSRFEKTETAGNEKIQEIKSKLDSIEDVLSREEAKRKEIVVCLPSESLAKYDMIRPKRNGQAVVEVSKDTCQGCQMNIPPQLVVELLKTREVIQCPNCQRIFVHKEIIPSLLADA